MADRPKSDGDLKAKPGRRSGSPAPRWVKLFGLVALVLFALFVILHLTGHGFGHHMHMSILGQEVRSSWS